MTLDLRLLGGFQLSWCGELRVLPSARARSLLTRLALYPGEQQARARVAMLFWPDSTDTQARTNLRRLLHDLGQALPDLADFLILDGPALAWRADAPATVDVAAFVALAARRQEAEALAQAVTLYRGDLFPECYDDWIVPDRERLRALFTGALTAGIALGGASGDWSTALAYAARLIELDPLDEEAHRQRIQLHLRRGDRGAAIRAYQECVATLERELAITPSAATRALFEQARQPDAGEARSVLVAPSVVVAPAVPQHSGPLLPSLPLPATPILGRERETRTITALLRQSEIRVITLTGPGGIGKTRLALHVAVSVRADFADGIAFVPLGALSDSAIVLPTIARTLGVVAAAGQSDAQALETALCDRRLLLVLDNLEQLLTAVPDLAALLARVPGVKVLVTSRLPLRLRGEYEFLVAPLPLPEPHEAKSIAALEETPSTALFLARARAADQRFTPTDADTATIIAICRRLDGLPLAIELAAPRIKLMPLPTLLARLDSRLALLVGGARDLPARQQTIRATLDWSYALLSSGEQQLLGRLAVFEGGSTLTAIEAVADDDQLAVVDALGALHNQGLVLRHDPPDVEPRFLMLELVREYARERLSVSAEAAMLRVRHARYYLTLAEELSAALTTASQVARQRELTIEEENLRGVLRWATETGEVEAGLRLAGALVNFWGTRGAYREGQAWLDGLLAQRDAAGLPPALEADALYSATMMVWRGGDYTQARRYGERALTQYRALAQAPQSAAILRILANIAMIEQDNDGAQALLDEAEALVRDGQHPRDLALVLNTQGELARAARRDYVKAERHYREALALARNGGTQELATYLGNLGMVVLRRGDVMEALRLLREGLELRVALGHRRGFAICLEYFGALAITVGRFSDAARFYGAAEVLREELNSPRGSDPADDAEHQGYLVEAAERADPRLWAEDWSAGRALPLDRVIAAALALTSPQNHPDRGAGSDQRSLARSSLLGVPFADPS